MSWCDEVDGALEIEDAEDGEEVGGIASQRMTSGPRPAVEALHLAEDTFDRRPIAGDEIVAPLLARRKRRFALVAAFGDAVLDAGLLQGRPPGLLRIGLVAVDRPLVPRDQLIGDLALIGLGAGEHGPTDQAGALIHGDMGLVAEMRAAVLLRPGCAAFARVAGSRPGRDLWRIVRGRNQGRIHQRSLLEDKAFGFELPIDLREARLHRFRLR